MNDGTQERTLDPPDDTLSDAEMRECERAASDGFDYRDDRWADWMEDQCADAAEEIRAIVTAALDIVNASVVAEPLLTQPVMQLRDRYIAECAEDYWPDLMDQAAHAQEA